MESRWRGFPYGLYFLVDPANGGRRERLRVLADARRVRVPWHGWTRKDLHQNTRGKHLDAAQQVG